MPGIEIYSLLRKEKTTWAGLGRAGQGGAGWGRVGQGEAGRGRVGQGSTGFAQTTFGTLRKEVESLTINKLS